MTNPKRDFIAESIASYDLMTQEEQGKMVLQLLEDQPVLMGFMTNLADDFEEDQHEVLIDSVAILIMAFISAGIVVEMIPEAIVSEVVEEKVQAYNGEKQEEEEAEFDSPLVFEDLKTRAILKCNFVDEADASNFNMIQDTLISIVERSIAIEMQKVENK